MERSRPLGGLLIAAAAWTWWIWIVRLVNMAGEDRSAGFVAVHATLAVVSLALAVPVAWVGSRLWRGLPVSPRRARRPPPG
jgi:hypothetical protein